MAIQVPFVRWEFVRHAPHLFPNGGIYYAYTAEGATEQVAMAVHTNNNHLVYRANIDFVHDYGNRLPLGEVFEWHLKRDLVKWLDALIYYSFLCYSLPGVPGCWFLKFISAPQIHGFEMLPTGLQPSFPIDYQITWIVIKHGYRVWAISVVNHQLVHGWPNFRRVHGLRVGCQVIFSCERQWVFNTTMFDENGHQMSYNWSIPNEPWQALHPLPGNLRTSCLPSVIENSFSFVRFSCQYTNQAMLHMVFTNFLEGIIESFALEELAFNVGNQSWTVQVGEDRTLESTSFAAFCMALELQRHDYIMVSVSWELEVQLIVFQPGNNREKIYGWF